MLDRVCNQSHEVHETQNITSIRTITHMHTCSQACMRADVQADGLFMGGLLHTVQVNSHGGKEVDVRVAPDIDHVVPRVGAALELELVILKHRQNLHCIDAQLLQMRNLHGGRSLPRSVWQEACISLVVVTVQEPLPTGAGGLQPDLQLWSNTSPACWPSS